VEFLVLAILIGLIPAAIASSKGKSFIGWWFYGAALFVVALPHSLMMRPDHAELERRDLEGGDTKKCPNCAEIIKKEAKVCRFCQRELELV
jgi:hypothetical protein